MSLTFITPLIDDNMKGAFKRGDYRQCCLWSRAALIRSDIVLAGWVDRQGSAVAAEYLGRSLYQEGQLDEAATYYAKALATRLDLFRNMPYDYGTKEGNDYLNWQSHCIGRITAGLKDVLSAQGKYQEAEATSQHAAIYMKSCELEQPTPFCFYKHFGCECYSAEKIDAYIKIAAL